MGLRGVRGERPGLGQPGPQTAQSIWQRARLRSRGGTLAITFLLLIVFLYFWPFFLRGEIIAPTDLLLRWPPWSYLASEDFHVKNHLRSDILDAYLPTLRNIREGVRDGNLPLWTPMRALGRPLASTLDSSYFHPLPLFFTTVFPLAEGFSLLVMSKLFLAGAFMYLFLRRWDVSRPGATVGGLAYMFSGFHIVWLMWPVTLLSAFAPLMFLETENLVREPRPRHVALLAGVIATMVLAGFPSVAGYFFYALGLYFLVRLGQTFLEERDLKRALHIGAAFSLSFALGVGISAFQLLPTLEMTDFIDIGYRRSLSQASLPLHRGIQLIFPNFYGNQVFGNYQGTSNLNETSGYVGIVTLALALLGFGMALVRRRLTVVFFGALALVSVLLVYSIGPFLGWVRHLPVFDLNPSTRLLSVFGLSAAVGAGFGFDELREFRLGGRLRMAALLLAGFATLVLAAMVGYLAYEAFERREILSAFLDNFPVMEFHTFRIVTVAFGATVLLLFTLVVLTHLRRPLAAPLLVAPVLLLLSVDLLFFAYRQNPTSAHDYFYPETPGITFLESNLKPNERFAPLDGSFMIPGTQMYYGLNSAYSHALYDERQRDVVRALSKQAFMTATAVVPVSANTNFWSPALDLFGIRYVTVPYRVNLFAVDPSLRQRFNLVYSTPGELRIYENRRFLPAFAAGHALVAEPGEILEAIRAGSFDPRTTAFVEEAPPAWADGDGASVASIQVEKYGSADAVYKVRASGPVLLVVPELDYPGWKASVDGEDRKIYRADYILRGVFVEGGEHTVIFRYDPESFRRGVIITLASLAAAASLLAFDFARRLRRGRPAAGR